MAHMYSPVKQPRKQFYVFLSKTEKSENFSSSSTGREKLIDLSNKLQDKLLKGITDLSVKQYHSNEYYKPYTLPAQRELENRKRKGMNALYTDTKLLEKTVNFTDYVKLKDQKLFLRATKFNMDSVFIKISIFDKPDDLFAPDIMGHRQCMKS